PLGPKPPGRPGAPAPAPTPPRPGAPPRLGAPVRPGPPAPPGPPRPGTPRPRRPGPPPKAAGDLGIIAGLGRGMPGRPSAAGRGGRWAAGTASLPAASVPGRG